MSRLLALVLLVQSAVLSQSSPVVPASIRGLVVKNGTNQPLAGVSLELSAVSNGKMQSRIVLTKADGGFVFDRVPAASGYQLVAFAGVEYVPFSYGERAPGLPGPSFTLAAGQELHVPISLLPTARISGHIVDQAGKPARSVQVTAAPAIYLDGIRFDLERESTRGIGSNTRKPRFATTQTDINGEYSLRGLSPDHYFVRASPMSSFQQNQPAEWTNDPIAMAMNRAGGESPVLTYYPSARNLQAAMPIDLHSGDSARDINVTLLATALSRRVRGAVTDAGGRPVRASELRIVPRDKELVGVYESVVYRLSAAIAPQSSSFDIWRIPRGSYYLVAFQGGARRGTESLPPTGYTMLGRVPFEMHDADVKDLTITLAPGMEIEGQIRLEVAGAERNVFPLFRVSLRPVSVSMPQPAHVGLSADGAFKLQDVMLGDYTVNIFPLLPYPESGVLAVPTLLRNVYVKSIHMGTVDLLNEALRIDGPVSQRIEIALSSNGGAVSGRVLDEKGLPVSNRTAVLVPDTRRNRADLYKPVWTDDRGGFTVEGIAPGGYKMFAWQHVAYGAWQDAEFMRNYEQAGTPVLVGDGTRHQVEVTVIPSWR